jgi:hypothetical protein
MKIMNPFEMSTWVLFVFIVNIFLIAFIFIAKQASYSQKNRTDDERGESIAEKIEGKETK